LDAKQYGRRELHQLDTHYLMKTQMLLIFLPKASAIVHTYGKEWFRMAESHYDSTKFSDSSMKMQCLSAYRFG